MQKLKMADYQTHFIGKGHLGYQTDAHLPVNRGFDTHVGYLGGAESYSYGNGSPNATQGKHVSVSARYRVPTLLRSSVLPRSDAYLIFRHPWRDIACPRKAMIRLRLLSSLTLFDCSLCLLDILCMPITGHVARPRARDRRCSSNFLFCQFLHGARGGGCTAARCVQAPVDTSHVPERPLTLGQATRLGVPIVSAAWWLWRRC